MIKRVGSLILLIVLAYTFPVCVLAKTYNYPGDIKNALYGQSNQSVVRFQTGDEIVFNYNVADIYVDDVKVSNECYGSSCPTNTYRVTDDVCFSYAKGFTNIYVYFISCSKDINVNDYSESMEKKYFKSGDYLAFKGIDSNRRGINPRLYDFNDNLLSFYDVDNYAFGVFSNGGDYNKSYFLLKFPQIDDNDIYWEKTIFNDGAYSYPSPHFTPFDYKEPKIELKCDKDKINYGEKTKCEVCIECIHAINKLEFSMNQKDLKFSNYSFSNGVTNTGNNNSIKLNITDNNICNEKKTIMTFDVEGTKDSSYLDKLSLNNIEYTDELLTAKYNDLDSDLNIISTKPLTNPETGIKGLFVVIPILLLLIVSEMSTIRRKKYEK